MSIHTLVCQCNIKHHFIPIHHATLIVEATTTMYHKTLYNRLNSSNVLQSTKKLYRKLVQQTRSIHKSNKRLATTLTATTTTGTLLYYTASPFIHTQTTIQSNDNNQTIVLCNDQTNSNKSLDELTEQYIINDNRLITQQNDMKLLFTDNDNDIHHKNLEILLRNTQANIINAIVDIEKQALNDVDKNILQEIYQYDDNNNNTIPTTINYPADIVIRPDGSGGGIARVYQNGIIFEKAGVSTSFARRNVTSQFFIDQQNEHDELKKLVQSNNIPTHPVPLFTASISLVIHPRNPHCPTVHANYRYFQIDLENGKQIWWYGGGSDLTPMYVNNNDAKHFHSVLKNTIDKSDKSLYDIYKQNCDDYFFIRHRNERRGIGGIFFEDQYKNKSKQQLYNMIHMCCQSFNRSYFPIIQQHKYEPYNIHHWLWQQYRRGRYVEFNLVYDRGTTYGLTHMPPKMARPDAVLMSLPPICKFAYNMKIQQHTPEYDTIDVLQNPKQWV